MTRRRPQHPDHLKAVQPDESTHLRRRPHPFQTFFAYAAFLFVLSSAFGAAGGEMPSEKRADAIQTKETQPVQSFGEHPDQHSVDGNSDHEKISIPSNRTLAGGGAVQLIAESAHVVIRWDAEPGFPHVRAQWSFEGPAGELLLSSRAGASTLRYVSDPNIEGYPVIELHLSPDQGAAVFGGSLSVDALQANQSYSPQRRDSPTPPLEIEVVGSEVTLIDIPTLTFKGEETVLYARGGFGSWTMDIRGGSSELTDHKGSVDFTGSRTEASFEAVDNIVNLDLSETTVLIRKCNANVQVTTSGGTIDCEETRGILNISGSSALVNLRGVHSNRLTVTGEDLYVDVEGGRGPARATLTRGSFSATGWATRIDLTARDGAAATVRDLDGDIAFDAGDGAIVGIFGVTGHVRGRATRATIEVSSLKSIALKATSSEITVENTRELTVFDLTDSTAYLNLYELRGDRAISLNGSSRAEIELRYPCHVRVEGPAAGNAGRISVDGCENLRPGQRWPQPRVQRQGSEPVKPIHLAIKMSQRADVSVRGY